MVKDCASPQAALGHAQDEFIQGISILVGKASSNMLLLKLPFYLPMYMYRRIIQQMKMQYHVLDQRISGVVSVYS